MHSARTTVLGANLNYCLATLIQRYEILVHGTVSITLSVGKPYFAAYAWRPGHSALLKLQVKEKSESNVCI